MDRDSFECLVGCAICNRVKGSRRKPSSFFSKSKYDTSIQTEDIFIKILINDLCDFFKLQRSNRNSKASLGSLSKEQSIAHSRYDGVPTRKGSIDRGWQGRHHWIYGVFPEVKLFEGNIPVTMMSGISQTNMCIHITSFIVLFSLATKSTGPSWSCKPHLLMFSLSSVSGKHKKKLTSVGKIDSGKTSLEPFLCPHSRSKRLQFWRMRARLTSPWSMMTPTSCCCLSMSG